MICVFIILLFIIERMQIQIPEDSLTCFSRKGKEEAKKRLTDFSQKLISEAQREEYATNTSDQHEITTSHVINAYYSLTHRRVVQKRNRWKICAQIGSILFPAIASGWWGTLDRNSTLELIGFIVVCAFALLCSVFSFIPNKMIE